MGAGVGIVLLVVGAIFYWALDVDIPGIDEGTMGVILMIAGVLAIALSLVVGYQRTNTRTTHVEEQRRQ